MDIGTALGRLKKSSCPTILPRHNSIPWIYQSTIQMKVHSSFFIPKATFVAITAVLLLINSAQAQGPVSRSLPTIDTPLYLTPGTTMPQGEVVLVELEHQECLSDEVFALINAEADANVAQLATDRPELLDHSRGGRPAFIWPTRAKDGFDDYGYYTVNFLYDHNPAQNSLQDYSCGTRTYDWFGGNHKGTDIILWPYAWRSMQEEVMEIVAAASGTVVIRRDGYSDVNCAIDGNSNWNGYVIQHEHGSRAWYMHFKNGSISEKVVGETVEAGEYLGLAGSSGSSNWPHLHFEVRTGSGSSIDPWDGECNSTNPGESWWAEQQAVKVPRINHISTHNSRQHDNSCPTPEVTYEDDVFNNGDSLVFKLHYRDLDLNSVTSINIVGPSGTPFISWEFTSPWSFSPTTYAYWSYVVDQSWPTGAYMFSAELDGHSYQREFFVGTASSAAEQHATAFEIHPNPAAQEVFISGIPISGTSVQLTLRDAIGRSVHQQQIAAEHQRLDLSGLSNGIYLIELEGSTFKASQRLVVQH